MPKNTKSSKTEKKEANNEIPAEMTPEMMQMQMMQQMLEQMQAMKDEIVELKKGNDEPKEKVEKVESKVSESKVSESKVSESKQSEVLSKVSSEYSSSTKFDRDIVDGNAPIGGMETMEDFAKMNEPIEVNLYAAYKIDNSPQLKVKIGDKDMMDLLKSRQLTGKYFKSPEDIIKYMIVHNTKLNFSKKVYDLKDYKDKLWRAVPRKVLFGNPMEYHSTKDDDEVIGYYNKGGKFLPLKL